MRLVQDVWNWLKSWRSAKLGPVSIVYRFRRTVRISRNRGRGTSLNSFPAIPYLTAFPPAASFLIAPENQCLGVKENKNSEVAVVFGVGPGFGSALARKLVLNGAQVALVSRQAEHLRTLAEELNAERSGGGATVYSCDATDDRGVREVFSLVACELGVPSLVVYSTQNTVRGQAIEIETDAFEDCWRTNCLGGFIVAREAARAMQPHKRGSIVLIGSTSALIGREGHLSLAVGKFGLRAVSQVMARELWKDGIHVAHVVIDADIREPGGEVTPSQSDPSDIADLIYSVHRQPKTAWASEVDVRPWNEKFWEHC